MEDIIVSKDEIIELFENAKIIDTGEAWLMDDNIVDIIALHDVEPKFLQDLTNAKFYKIKFKSKIKLDKKI